jgi:hypothetical protein
MKHSDKVTSRRSVLTALGAVGLGSLLTACSGALSSSSSSGTGGSGGNGTGGVGGAGGAGGAGGTGGTGGSTGTSTGTGTNSGPWYRQFHKNGKSPYMKLPWAQGGTFLNTGKDVTGTGDVKHYYVPFLGAFPDAYGGNIMSNGKSQDWDHLIGGPVSLGDAHVSSGTQLDLKASDHLAYWVESAPQDTWGILCCTTAPESSAGYGTFLDMWKAIGNGDRDDQYELMGKRLRWYIDNQTDRRFDSVILRPNWEMNQDTGLKPAFFQNGGTVDLYNKMMERFAKAIRKGYGHHLPIALAPAMTPIVGPYEDLLGNGIYDLLTCSYHPSRANSGTQSKMMSTLHDGGTNYYSVALVLEMAEKHGIPAAFLEWSPREENTTYGVGAVPECVVEFQKMLVAKQDLVAMTLIHSERVYQPNLFSGTQWDQLWKDTCQNIKERFGKGVV